MIAVSCIVTSCSLLSYMLPALFTSKWLLYVPPDLTFNHSTFYTHTHTHTHTHTRARARAREHTQCIYVFCVDLKTNSDYFSVQF
jgi:hypothetical protein